MHKLCIALTNHFPEFRSMANAFRNKQSVSQLAPPDQEITVVYQRPGSSRPEIQLFPLHTKNVENHQQAYSRFKSGVCRLFELPKSTPFMLKDQVAGVKMTRERYSEFLTCGRFPVVWKLVTAQPSEDGGKRSLVQLNSTASIMSTATMSSDTLQSDTSEKQRSKSVSSVLDTPSLHSLSRTLSLGWNEHTNTYGLETQCIKVADKQLVFISKRSQSLSLCSPVSSQSDLSVGDVILKIEGRPVGEMNRDEISLHLNYPQAQLESLTLSVVPWTRTPPEIKEVILRTMAADSSQLTAVSTLPPPNTGDAALTNHSPRLPSTRSDPCFNSIPVSPIDDPLFPQPIKSPDSSPRRRKNRFMQSIGSPVEAGLSPPQRTSVPSSPSKMLGFLTGNKSRGRSSCTRSESFAFIPSFPEANSIPESPLDCTYETNKSADCLLETTQTCLNIELNRSAGCILETSDLPVLKIEHVKSPDSLLDPTLDAYLDVNPFSPIDTKPELTDSTPQPSPADSPNPELTVTPNLESDLKKENEINPELTILPNAKPMLEKSADLNPELTVTPNLETDPKLADEINPELTIIPNSNPELTIMPNSNPELTIMSNSNPELTIIPNSNPELTIMSNSNPELTIMPNSNPELTIIPNSNPELTIMSNSNPELTIMSNSNPELTIMPNSNPELTIMPNSNPELTIMSNSNPELTIIPNSNPELTIMSNSNPELTIMPNSNPELTIIPNSNPELTIMSNSNPELTIMPNSNPELTIMPNSNPELTIMPNSNPELTIMSNSNPELTGDCVSKLRVASDLNPELTLTPSPDLGPSPSLLEPELSALTIDPLTGTNDLLIGTNNFRRTLSDPHSNSVFGAHSRLSSNSPDLDTEEISGMYYVTDPTPIEAPLATGTFQLINHPSQPFQDTFDSPKVVPRNSHKGGNEYLPPTPATQFPRVTDGRETVVASSCTEFINPSFQGSVHGVYHSFDFDQSNPSQLSDVGPEITYYPYSSDESDYEDAAVLRPTVIPAGLATPLRPRKFPSYNPESGDMRPNSELIPRSNSEVTNLAVNARYFREVGDAGNNIPRIRLAGKKKNLRAMHQRAESNIEFLGESNLFSPSSDMPPGGGILNDKGAKRDFNAPKPAEFVHPAYRKYRQVGEMEIKETMCAKLLEKFQPISSGPLSRKQEMDGRLGKRAADRSWKNFYVCLQESDLIFYKSEKDYLFDKPFLKTLFAEGSEHHFCHDHIVSLHHASLLIPNDYMSQKRSFSSYVFRLRTENTSSYLMRAVSLPLMFGWLLSFIEARKLPPTDNPYPIGLFQEPDKRRVSGIEGANRYFQRIQQKVRSKLNFARRDSEMPPDPIFSNCILTCARSRDNEKIPLLVDFCVHEIEERGLESDGIYRVSGTTRHIRSMRDDLSKAIELDRADERWLDENNVSGLLKLFFKELTEPLVSQQLYDSLVTEVTSCHDSQGQLIRSLQQLLQTMPDMNYCTLDYLVAHLCRVAQYSAKNRMSIKNLAIVFGPTLITRRDLKGIQLICQTNAQVNVMEQLITHYDHIFNCRPIPEFLFESKRTPSMVSRRAARGSVSSITSDRFRRVSSTDPPLPLPSRSPPPPYPEHVPLEAKLSRSWSEEVLTRVNLTANGSDLDRTSPLGVRLSPNSLQESHPLNRRSSIGSRELLPHPLSNTFWHIPFEDIHSDPVTPFQVRRDVNDGRTPTLL